MFRINAKIISGEISLIDPIIEKYNPKELMILTSKSLAKTDIVASFVGKMKKLYQVIYCNNIQADAPIEDLNDIVNNYTKPDLIISIGGGSVLDSAKALSVCWVKKNIFELLKINNLESVEKIPNIAVPTTAGTGSELSIGAILYDEAENIKKALRNPLIRPDQVLIDPRLYLCAPKKFMAEVAFDCLTHAIETYMSIISTPLVRYNSINTIKILINHLDKSINGNLKSMEKLAISSAMMGVNLENSSTCLPHRIQYAFGKHFKATHAQGLIMIYRGWLPMIAKTEKFNELTKDLEMDIHTFLKFINNFINLYDINYKLGSYINNKEIINTIASDVYGKVEYDPIYNSPSTIIKILNKSL